MYKVKSVNVVGTDRSKETVQIKIRLSDYFFVKIQSIGTDRHCRPSQIKIASKLTFYKSFLVNFALLGALSGW